MFLVKLRISLEIYFRLVAGLQYSLNKEWLWEYREIRLAVLLGDMKINEISEDSLKNKKQKRGKGRQHH